MSCKDKPLVINTKNVNSATWNSNQKNKRKQIMAKSLKRTLEDYAFPIQTLQGITFDMSKLKPLTLTQKSWADIVEEDKKMQTFLLNQQKLEKQIKELKK